MGCSQSPPRCGEMLLTLELPVRLICALMHSSVGMLSSQLLKVEKEVELSRCLKHTHTHSDLGPGFC